MGGRRGVTSLASTVRGLLILGHTIASRAAILVSTLIIVALAAVARAQDGPIAPVTLVPHRAIYELSLDQTRGDLQISGSARADRLRFRRECL